jgi:SAM-dependent methyltransferase
MDTRSFYDDIADLYHLVYADWPASITLQAAVLDSILVEALGPGPHRILDVSCGIGTQTIGLASQGHSLTASDVSPVSVARARQEAETRRLDVAFSVSDMRQCDQQHDATFDAVLSADNAVPHLLSDDEIQDAFRAMHHCVRPNGVAVITVRDYAREDRTTPQLRPFGVRPIPDGQCVVFQVWHFDGDHYDVAMYFVRERANREPEVTVSRSRYYAVDTNKLAVLMGEAGFVDVKRIDERYFQPVLLARKAV